jgi:hypothetical protein
VAGSARQARKAKASADLRAGVVGAALGLPVVSDASGVVVPASGVVGAQGGADQDSQPASDNGEHAHEHASVGLAGNTEPKRADEQASALGEGKEGPGEGGGAGPTCGSHQPLRGAFAQSMPAPENIPISSENIPISSENIPQFLSEYIPPFAEEYPTYSENQDTEIDLPAPGSALKKLTVPKWVGRNPDGSIIPHTRSDEIARQITEWIALGAQVEEMAIRLNLRPGQIRHTYAYELQTGEFINNMEVGGAILRMAKETPQMAIFYAKARMGWRDGDKASDKEQPGLNITIHT